MPRIRDPQWPGLKRIAALALLTSSDMARLQLKLNQLSSAAKSAATPRQAHHPMLVMLAVHVLYRARDLELTASRSQAPALFEALGSHRP